MRKFLYLVVISIIPFLFSCQLIDEYKHNKDIEKFVEESLDAQADGDYIRLNAVIYSIDEYAKNLSPEERVRCIGYAKKYRERLLADSVYIMSSYPY